MLAIHWSPVKNTKHILKNGIKKSRTGVYCFPLTGHRALDKWWAGYFKNHYFINKERKTQYDGFIFRIKQADLPARFSDGDSENNGYFKFYNSIDEIERNFREIMLLALGGLYVGLGYTPALHGRYAVAPEFINDDNVYNMNHEDIIQVANSKINSGVITFEQLRNDFDFMWHVFEDYLIILFNSIKPNRIIKVISDRNDDKKASHKYKKNRDRQMDEISEYFANV